MNERQVRTAIFLIGAAIIITAGVRGGLQTHKEERSKRKLVLDEMGLDVAAIHNATDVVNAKIERGEIRNMDELREAVLTEVAFQKVVIREDL